MPQPPANAIEMPYGLWRSPMDPAELLSQPSAPMYPFRHRGRLHWLEALPQEGGRIALMREPRQCLTPAEFNIRSRVHEYGGRCFCLLGGEIIFNNFSDGRIYRQPLSGDRPPAPTAVTAPEVGGDGQDGCSVSFADLVPLGGIDAVIAVRETVENGAARDALVFIDLSGEAARRGIVRPAVLVEGADFYACPVVARDRRELAWLEWDNPFMPWDQSRLVKAEWRGGGGGGNGAVEIHNRRAVVDGDGRAVCQPGFLDDGSLLFVSDGGADTDADADFWNFFQHNGDETRRITDHQHEYGEVHWEFGQRRWQGIGRDKIVAVASRHEGDRLLEISLASGEAAPLSEDFVACAHLRVSEAEREREQEQEQEQERELLLIARHADRGAEIRALTFPGGASRIVHAPPADPHTNHYSPPQPIAYPTRDGRRAYAYFYAPRNRHYRAPRAPAHSKPPLLVVVHGGPTGRATPELHPLKQFFASLGYAVLDINHRGSAGYGRAYRQCLLGRWGELDATDIADGVRHVLAQNWADPELVFIRGGSAGGYAVLRALTRFPRMFSGGACYYGIGNLITLAHITHKFEGCYLDRLVGETFDPDRARDPASRFVQRSPVFQLERLACPLILFQGAEDKVVPPEVSREVAELLEKKGIRHEYVEYENEGHGFRRLPTRVDSLERETAFFSALIRDKTGRSGQPAGDQPGGEQR